MNRDTFNNQLPSHALGIAIAAETLMRKIDRPGMTIELLRVSKEAGLFRGEIDSFSQWLRASIASQDWGTREEKLFLSYWFEEQDRVARRRTAT